MATRPFSSLCPSVAAFAVLVTVPPFSSVAMASGPSVDVSAPPSDVPAPPGSDDAISAGPEAGSTPAEEPAGVPEPEGPAASPEPEAPTEAAPEAPAETVPEPTVTAPTTTPPSTAEGSVDPAMLDAGSAEPTTPVTTRPAGTTARGGQSPEEQAEALDDAYAELYRPADNPVRINVTARVSFANIGGQQEVGGRMGGASVDVGPAWNYIGVAATLTGWGGRVLLPRGTGAELDAMLGGGLTVGLGRLALLSRGYLDLRLGYDVYYGVVNQRGDAPTILQPQADGSPVVATLTENLLPHGPRVRIDMGLVGSNSRNRFFHGFGMSMGYQALVGSLRGDLPFTNMLTLGFSYWMG